MPTVLGWARTSGNHCVVPVPKVWPEQPDIHAPHPRQQRKAAVEQCCAMHRRSQLLGSTESQQCNMGLARAGAWGVFLWQMRRASVRGSSSPSIVSTAWCASVTRTTASAGAWLPVSLPSAASCDLSAISTASRPSRTGPLCSQAPSADLSVGACPGSQENNKETTVW